MQQRTPRIPKRVHGSFTSDAAMFNTDSSLKVYTKNLRQNHISEFLLDFFTLSNGNKYQPRKIRHGNISLDIL